MVKMWKVISQKLKRLFKWLYKEELDTFISRVRSDELKFKAEWRVDLEDRNRIISCLLEKLGGQARIFDHDMLNIREVIAEVSRADNSTLFTLRKSNPPQR